MAAPGAAQFALILKKPTSNNIYYVFTVVVHNNIFYPGLWYSVVDMNMDGGLGAVTDEKNISVGCCLGCPRQTNRFKSQEMIKNNHL